METPLSTAAMGIIHSSMPFQHYDQAEQAEQAEERGSMAGRMKKAKFLNKVSLGFCTFLF